MKRKEKKIHHYFPLYEKQCFWRSFVGNNLIMFRLMGKDLTNKRN